MSWFNQTSLSSFAKTAFNTAQKSIDKALDIADEEDGSDPSASSNSAGRSGGGGLAKSGSVSSSGGDVEDEGSSSTRSSSNFVFQETDNFFSSFLPDASESAGSSISKPKRAPARRTYPPSIAEEQTKDLPSDGVAKPSRLTLSGKSLKAKSKLPQVDSDDSDERDKLDRKAVKPPKKPSGKRTEGKDKKTESALEHSEKKDDGKDKNADSVSEPAEKIADIDNKDRVAETILEPLHVDVGSHVPVIQGPDPSHECLSEDHDKSVAADESEIVQTNVELEGSAIDPDITTSTESFLLVRSMEGRDVDEFGNTVESELQGKSIESTCSNSTSTTATVEGNEKSASDTNIPSSWKSSDLDAKSESENTDEQTSVKSDSDFVVINEHTASEQSSVYLYDTRESPENISPKHYSSSSNGKRSPTDSDFSIISEGRFHDPHDPIHSGAAGHDVGTIVEQASMALMHRVSPSYSADIDSEDQDDKALTSPSADDERSRSCSEDGATGREEQNTTPTPGEKDHHEMPIVPEVSQEEETPRPLTDDRIEAPVPSMGTEDGPDDAMRPEKLLKKLAELAHVLEARESQILHLSQQNGELQESVTDLKQKVQKSEEARRIESSDLDNLTEEFTQRISAMEKKLQMANRERDQFKKDSQKLQNALDSIERNDTTSKLLGEKDEQIKELMVEGEKLSKQQLQNSTIIKKLRAKEKETDKLLKTQKDQLQEAQARVQHLEEVLDGKEELEKKQKDAIKTLNSAVERQEKDMAGLKGELEEAREKVRSTQHALDASYKEIAELHRNIASKESKVHETALSAEMSAKEELKLALDRSQLEARRQHEGLLLQVNDLQLTLNRADQQSSRKEDVFRQEIADLQQRLQEAEGRNQELSQSVTAATRPLLRQIENLQSTFNAQSSSWEMVEQNLTVRLADAQGSLAASTEKERAAQEGALEASSRVAALESQLAILRQEKSRLSALLEMEKARIESLEESKTRDFSHMENQLQNYLRSLETLQQDKVQLERQLELEKVKLESERRKLLMAQEALEEKEKRLQQSEELSGSRSPSSTSSTPTRPEFRPLFSTPNSRTPSQGEILERTMSTSMTGSVYDNIMAGSGAHVMENLQSQLKQREGEIMQLQTEIVQLERTRSSMAEEIVKLTNQTERLEDEVSDIPDLRRQLKELQHRYNAVLQMYGEKAEEVQELKLDLQDVKEMYRQQIEDLIRSGTGS